MEKELEIKAEENRKLIIEQEMKNTSVVSSSQQTNNKLNLIPRKVLCSKTFVRGK